MGDRKLQNRCSNFRLRIAPHDKPGQSQPDIGNHRWSVGRHSFGAEERPIGATGEGGVMALTPTKGEALLDAARELVPAIVGARDDIERERRLPSSLVDAMRNAQLFELWLPKIRSAGY